MNVMCGIDSVPPFQGLNGFGAMRPRALPWTVMFRAFSAFCALAGLELVWGRVSQGVALGYHVLRFQRTRQGEGQRDGRRLNPRPVLQIPRAKGARHDSPGQRPGFGFARIYQALKGRNNIRQSFSLNTNKPGFVSVKSEIGNRKSEIFPC